MSTTLLLGRLPTGVELQGISARGISMIGHWRLDRDAFFLHCWNHYLMRYVGDKLSEAASLYAAGWGPSEITLRLEDVLRGLALRYLETNQALRHALLAFLMVRIAETPGLHCALGTGNAWDTMRVMWRTG